MIPTLLELGPLPIHSFGLMIVLAFVTGWRRLVVSLQSQGESIEIAEGMVFWTAIGGMGGARILYVLSHLEQFADNPLKAVFTGAGFVFYGGFIGSILALYLVVRKHHRPFVWFLDICSPCIALGYAVGRIGCQLAGDGDYGTYTSLPWGMSYELGYVPTEIGARVHPTPLYESMFALFVAWVLLAFQKKGYLECRPGFIVGLYFTLAALSRFFVEFIRRNPEVVSGFTQAQVISVGVFIAGTSYLIFSLKRPARA